MKIPTFLIVFSIAALGSEGFVPVTNRHRAVALNMAKKNFFENLFQPMHGHGTGEGHYQEMTQEEQALLNERREKYSKKDLKKKYAKPQNWMERMFNNPVQFHGSGEDQIDEQYKTQQQILYERREHINKDQLKNKYKDNKDHLNEIKTIQHDPKALNQAEDDAMWVDENERTFKFPWDNKLKP